MAKTTKTKLDFDGVKEHARTMEERLSPRVNLFRELEDMYRLYWKDEPANKDPSQPVKATLSVDPHNSVNAVMRLLATSKPQYIVKPTKDDEDARKDADRMERTFDALVLRSNSQQRIDAVSELVAMFAIYGTAVLKVTDLRAMQRFKGNKQAFSAWPKTISPIVFKPLHPGSVFYDLADWGISAVVEKRTRTVGDVKRSWGDAAADLQGKDRRSLGDNDPIDFYDYWSYSPFEPTGTHCVWCEGM